MTTRNELYRAFGPKLIEAFADLVLDEINALRNIAGLNERTKQQMADALKSKLDLTEDYTWMNEQPRRN